MCNNCRTLATRRSFLTGATAGLLGLATGSKAWAAPPKPGNVMTPQAALDRLIEGNQRYAQGTPKTDRRAGVNPALEKGQNPFAAILGCADSRVSPELAFDEEQGDLFVTRVAGNYISMPLLASLEYAVAVLNTPLVFVLGHSGCGAISAAVQAYQHDRAFPGHIQNLTTELSRPVKIAVQSGAKDLVAAATVENVRLNVSKLATSNPILRRAVRDGKLMVAGGVYDLASGKIALV